MNQCVFCIETFFILRLFYEKKLHKIPVPPVVFFYSEKVPLCTVPEHVFFSFFKVIFLSIQAKLCEMEIRVLRYWCRCLHSLYTGTFTLPSRLMGSLFSETEYELYDPKRSPLKNRNQVLCDILGIH